MSTYSETEFMVIIILQPHSLIRESSRGVYYAQNLLAGMAACSSLATEVYIFGSCPDNIEGFGVVFTFYTNLYVKLLKNAGEKAGESACIQSIDQGHSFLNSFKKRNENLKSEPHFSDRYLK